MSTPSTPIHQISSEQQQWLNNQLQHIGISNWEFSDLIADASFRAYSRILHPRGSLILMHFPPAKEDGKRIVETSNFFSNNGVQVPKLYAQDVNLGVVLQQDMGKELLSLRNASGVNTSLYKMALEQLNLIQQLDASQFGSLDKENLMEEMQLFSKWFVSDWLSCEQEVNLQQLNELYTQLTSKILEAPQCCVHLDFHSRNLCVVAAAKQENGTPDGDSDDKKYGKELDKEYEHIGILDYQDVLQGHFCYDAWSLLRDAYILLPQNIFDSLLDDFITKAAKRFNLEDKDYITAQFNLIGIQRCLKVCGIFARLSLRDGKAGYLQHIPLVMDYLQGAINNLSNYANKQDEVIIADDVLLAPVFEILSKKARDKLALI